MSEPVVIDLTKGTADNPIVLYEEGQMHLPEPPEHSDPPEQPDPKRRKGDGIQLPCPITMQPFWPGQRLCLCNACGNTFGEEAIFQMLQVSMGPACPFCRVKIVLKYDDTCNCCEEQEKAFLHKHNEQCRIHMAELVFGTYFVRNRCLEQLIEQLGSGGRSADVV